MIYNENILNDSKGRLLIKSYFSTALRRTNLVRIHHHAECELSAIISGEGIYKTKNKSYSISPGNVFLFSGDEEHCITDIYSECKILNIHFVPRILWSDGDISLSKIFFARNENYQNKIDPDNPETQKLYNAIISIENELSQKNSGYMAMAKYKLLSAITSIIRNYGYIDDSVNYTSYLKMIKPMEKALKYIEENLTQKITLSEISESANMNPTYFSTIFKKLNGISPWEYITAKRIDKAIELIRTTDMTKLDIAMQCGFQSSSNFYKAFVNITGKKPGDFR